MEMNTQDRTSTGTVESTRIYPKNTKYCFLCRHTFLIKEIHEHMHSMMHHDELAKVVGRTSKPCHECVACQTIKMDLSAFNCHISTYEHELKLKELQMAGETVQYFKRLGEETINLARSRNKKLKNSKRNKKKKMKLKDKMSSQSTKQQEKPPNNKNTPAGVRHSNQQKQQSTKQHYQLKMPAHPPLSKHPHPAYSSPASLTQPSDQLPDTGGMKLKTDKMTKQSPEHQEKTPNKNNPPLTQPSPSAHNRNKSFDSHMVAGESWDTSQYYNSYSCGKFTSDQLPDTGAIIFGASQTQSTIPPKPKLNSSQKTSHSNTGASAPAASSKCRNKATNSTPIQDTDANTLLWEIRRALGLREPCRAERQARTQRQIIEARAQAVEHSAAMKTKSNETLTGSLCLSKNTEGMYLPRGISREDVDHSTKTCSAPESKKINKVSNMSKPGTLPTSINKRMGKTIITTKRNTNVACKAPGDIDPCPSQPVKEAGFETTVKKSVCSSGFEGKSAKHKCMPRFGIAQDDTPEEIIARSVSEGFCSESSMVHDPIAAPFPMPAPLQLSGDSISTLHGPSESRLQMGFGDGRNLPATRSAVVLKNNRYPEEAWDETGKVDNTMKRSADDGFNMEPIVKKKKIKSKKSQDKVEELLSVSLREEELSKSVQDLDISLIEARKALEFAYHEVQRLLLLKQQYCAEVSSLRAKRIEILQGLQGGYSDASCVVEERPPVVQSARPPSASPPNYHASMHPLPFTAPAQSPTPTSHSPPTPLPQKPTEKPEPHLASEAPISSVAMPTPLTALLPTPLVPKAEPSDSNTQSSSSEPAAQHLDQDLEVSRSDQGKMDLGVRKMEVSVAMEEDQPLMSHFTTESEESNDAMFSDGVLPTVESNLDTMLSDAVLPTGESNLDTMLSKGVLPTGESNLDTMLSDGKAPVSDVEMHQEEPLTACDTRQVVTDLDVMEHVPKTTSEVIDLDEFDNEETPKAVCEVSKPQDDCDRTQTVMIKYRAGTGSNVPIVATKDNIKTSPELNAVEDKEPSLGSFQSHTGPVNGIQIHEGLLFTCSGDNTARAFNLVSRECQAVFEGHTNSVNCLLVVSSAPNMFPRLYTGSSDHTVRYYSLKTKKCLGQITLTDRVLCLQVVGSILYAGLSNGSVVSFDLKTLKELDVFECHGPRGVSCIAASQEGARRILLVGSYDSTISVRDAKSGLLLRSLTGHTKTVLCIKVVNDLVFSGSSDTSVHAHNIHTGELVRIYKGHSHAVTSIDILGNVMVTACLDKLVRIYELQSHDRLQVYGGHTDLVICMAIHKSVIYTGCYDGTVQVVKLNLMENYRCWWHGCSLIFGVAQHLMKHLVEDHTNIQLRTIKCRWRGCDSFFSTPDAVRLKLPVHMQSHIDNDSKLDI